MEEILIHLGYEVYFKSGTGLDFIEQLALADDPPDIIISEVQVDDLRDISLFRHLRYHYPSVRLLAFSADNSEWNMQTAKADGAHAFLEKGCSLLELQDMLEQLRSPRLVTR
jgi:CheY-like chemotaxis protein